jgi:hypothetical protein
MRHLLFAFFVLALGVFAACGNNNTSADTEGAAADSTTVVEEGVNANDVETMEVDSTGPEYTSAYICPMHCKGSGSDAPGACPVCGMDYVANTNHPMHQGEGTEEGESHEGHNH